MACFGVILISIFVTSSPIMADDDPDDLYRQGRFAEAEKGYAEEDMNRPKDIRFRYNRGCSAYQNGDYQAAMAAFSSVLTRANDDAIRFRAAYNMGNTAFKQGDPAAAIRYYKEAILHDPNSGDALHNLELALRKQEEQKKQADSKDQKDSDTSENQEGQPKEEEKEASGEGSDQSSREDSSQKEPSQEEPSQKEQPEDEKNRDGKGNPDSEQQKGDHANTATENDLPREGDKSPSDLSGELKPRDTAVPEEKKEGDAMAPSAASIDQKKAEALLDNIKEDHGRFLRYQVPEEKRGGVSSGKEW